MTSLVRPRRAAVAAALLVPLVAGPLGAQTVSPRDSLVVPDSLVMARELGAAAGDRRGAAGYFFAGFVIGAPTGLATAVALSGSGSSEGNLGRGFALGGVAAVAVLATSAGQSAASPSAGEAVALPSDTPALREAFDDAYAGRVQSKRRRRVVQGAVAGAVTAVVLVAGALAVVIGGMGG